MPHPQFSLKAADKKRLVKDRLIRFAVSAGGVSVLGALVLIFVYLIWVALPLFSSADITVSSAHPEVSLQSSPIQLSVGEHGQYVFMLDRQGEMIFRSTQDEHQEPVWHKQLPFMPEQSAVAGEWFAVLGQKHQLEIARPLFSHRLQNGQDLFVPGVEQLELPSGLNEYVPADVQQFTFSVLPNRLTLAFSSDRGALSVLTYRQDTADVTEFRFPGQVKADELLVTPDGDTLYVREGEQLIVAIRSGTSFRVREVVDLTEGQSERKVVQMILLPGGDSLLVRHRDGQVTQWFDVIREEKRQLMPIREFKTGLRTGMILADAYHQGFFSFHHDGQVRNYQVTNHKQVLSQPVFKQLPELVALSENEKYLVSYEKGRLSLAEIHLGYPEISFSALWQKLWYENYPKPEYVWQSTAASDSFEPKFSLMPIAFGTIKAAMYSMLFAVPIAVLAAIYTAYFMSARMRRKVKPTIELMEALPTVIIGFLAGLWLAPIVERHLVSVVVMCILLPLSTVLFGLIWHFFPERWRRPVRRGWHAAILLPVLAVVMVLVLPVGFDIETWLFHGDIRVFMAQYGIDFNQRNSLVVGIAMGFAVIPTIFTIAEDAIFSVPKHLSDGSLALGATPWQTLTHVVLLTASPGIFSAVMMGLGRAVGETMIVLMATGNTPIMDWNIFEGMRTLAATIAVELPEAEVGSSQYRLLFLGALLLFVFTFLVNALAEWIRLRLREKYRAL
ncbi:ABC transporter permease subunit [Vibrio mangrovi]|uniref:Phosphate transport system permease protein PstC n=1 Tax=Vibrio mangrovi TaxID=474394 RepID=A0A1Y6IQW7_9VIBR|nr:ABC transporter permease subunit [Vibrio mangrovi]SMS00037.1 Phosphate transport system permease protein PstC [Vibrio mangrovi]